MKTCCFCGRSDQPLWLNDAAAIRCKDGPACDEYRRQRKAALRGPAVKPHERRSDQAPTPDEAKAAWADSRNQGTGGTATATVPAVKAPAPAEKPERRTVDEILYGVRGDAPDLQPMQAQLRTTGDAPRPTGVRASVDELLFGISRRSADVETPQASASGASDAERHSRIDALLFGFGAGGRKDSNADSSDSNAPTSLQLRAWNALEAAVASGDDAAMVNALLVWSQVSGIELGKSAKATLDEILYGGGRKTVTITVSDDEDAEGEDDTQDGEAPNLALTADQAMYWQALQQAVSAGGVGIDVESLTTAARNFYNSVSIGIL